jgi:hypothetical protein
LYRKLTRSLFPISLKRLLFALLETDHFQFAKVGSIQHANQHSRVAISPKPASAGPLSDDLIGFASLETDHFQFTKAGSIQHANQHCEGSLTLAMS